MKLNIFLLALLPFFCYINVASAEQSQNIGNHTVHYISVNSSFIDADIAQQYNIVRGDRHAFLNISVLKNEDDGSTTPVTAIITGSKRNLLSQNTPIDFIKITEGDAIYYLGQFEFSNAENARFKIAVQPEASKRSYTIKWQSKLYNN